MKSLDKFILFILKTSFLVFVGILILKALNEISLRSSNSYLVSWKWLNSLFLDTDPIGGIIILVAILSGFLYLFWLCWDPLMTRIPKQI